jgi:hypothetical protein
MWLDLHGRFMTIVMNRRDWAVSASASGHLIGDSVCDSMKQDIARLKHVVNPHYSTGPTAYQSTRAYLEIVEALFATAFTGVMRTVRETTIFEKIVGIALGLFVIKMFFILF